MDLLIRQHLSAAQNEQGNDALNMAYKLMKDASTERSAIDSSDSFSSDLYVLCAEQALQMGYLEMSQDCLQMYFKAMPHTNQFFGRAYLCQAQITAPHSVDDLEHLEKCVGFFRKAIEYAKPHERYHFLIYNASVLFWQIARPFLKSGYRHLLIPGLTEIIKALEHVKDQDSDWRAELMLEFLECLLEARKMKEAAAHAALASTFIKENAPHKYPQLFTLMVLNKLMDSTKAAKEMNGSVKLSLIYKIKKIKRQSQSKDTSKDVTTNLNELYELLANVDGDADLTYNEKLPLVLELAHLCLELNCVQLAFACISDLKNSNITDPGMLLAISCLECEYEGQKLGKRITTYSKRAVESQLKLVRRLELALDGAIRLSEPSIIEVACASLWNLCLPLLQHNLCKHLRKPLLSVAESLEQIDSSLRLLRCQVHLELSRIDEDADRIEVAIGHIEKAMLVDDGQYQDQLKIAFRRLKLCATLYTQPDRVEDQATMLIEQAKKGSPKDGVRKNRSLLVNAGLALAPNEFQMVLDSENEAKVSTGKNAKGQISFLFMKAQHHADCVQKASEHLTSVGEKNAEERVRLWADLAKVARKQEVWDVCRTACRFCLLYDDGRWKVPKSEILPKKSSSTNRADDSRTSLSESVSSTHKQSFDPDRAFLRMLAEIRFINAEATIHLLRSEGCLLNNYPVPPEDKSKHPVGYVAKSVEEDPEWLGYRDWIKQLSQYATENFLKAAELGVELAEAWITHNAVVYVLNHNKHLIRTGRQAELVNTLQLLLNAMKETGHNGNTVLLVMLSNALAQGLLVPWIPVPSQKKLEVPPQAEKSKKGAARGSGKANVVHVFSVDPNALPSLKTALEICEYVLDLTNGKIPDEVVPIAARHQIITTWVKAKHLLQQQIGPELGTKDENNEGQNLMTKVLVALEMYSCNGLGFMDFTVPTLSQLEQMCAECCWSDRLMELQCLIRIAHFSFNAHDYELAKTCCQRALLIDDNDCNDSNPAWCNYTLEQEMLSIAACIQGQSIMETLDGNTHLQMLALKAFQASASYAGKAASMELVIKAAKYFWNACLPLLGSPAERHVLKQPTQYILKAFVNAESKIKQQGSASTSPYHSRLGLSSSEPVLASPRAKMKGQASAVRLNSLRESIRPHETEAKQITPCDTTRLHLWPTSDFQIQEDAFDSTVSSGSANAEEDLAVRVALNGLLFHMYADKNDWETGLKVLNQAIESLPRSKPKLLMFKHRVLVNARLGCNFLLDIQKFKDESEDNVSYTWHRLALAAKDTVEQLSCCQHAIDALQKPESEWLKVDYLIELAEWLYFKQFPVTDALSQLDWAMDILLKMKLTKSADIEEKSPKGKSKARSKYSAAKDNKKDDLKPGDTERDIKTISQNVANLASVAEEKVVIASNPIDDLSNVRQLEYLVRIHTVMAVMIGHSSPHYQQHCLMAYAYVIRIWQVSLSAAAATIKAQSKNPPPSATQIPQSAYSKKGKDKKEAKQVPPAPIRERPKRKGPIDALPVSVEDWASYDCPDEVRDAFKTDTSCYSVNSSNFLKPTYSLYYMDLLVKELHCSSLTHLTIPVLQLAEVIAHDVVESKSLSDLYHLRIAQICEDLKLSQIATYHQKAVGKVFINEMEQVLCRQEIYLHKKKAVCTKNEGTNRSDEKQCHSAISDEGNSPVKHKDKILDLDAATGKGLSGLSMPYLWLDKGDVLIQLGLYQPARRLLSEAHKASQELNDEYAVARCLYLLAVLANKEHSHGQARALLEEAQQTEAGAEFWYKITLSLVQAVLGEHEEGKEKKAAAILQTTINAFKNLLPRRGNRRSELGFFISSLEARKILIQTQSAQELSAFNATSSQGAVMLLEACDKMNQIEKDLLDYGYKENSAQVIMQHAIAQRLLARFTEDEERKHCHYVDAYILAQTAVRMTEEVLYDIQSLFALNEIRGISLPVMRRLASMKLSLAELTLEMFDLVCIENQKKILLEKQKGSMHKMIEEYVRATPDYTSTELEWINTSRVLCHTALTHLESVLALPTTCFGISSHCLYLTGKSLRLLASRVDPLGPDIYWNENILSDANLPAETSPGTGQEPVVNEWTFGAVQGTNQPNMYMKKGSELKVKRVLAQKYLSQATEVLMQSMNIAINNHFIATLSAASLETVLCLGNFDPGSAGQYLALHQSCRASIFMEEILLTATSNTSSSQMAALLHLQHLLKEQGDTTSGLFKSVEERLMATSKAWENLLIQPQHLNIVNDLPPNFNIIIMQHSEDRSVLYGAVLEKSKSNGAQKGKSNQQDVKSKVARCAVDSNLLVDLLEKMQQYKQEVMQDLLKRQYQKSISTKEAGFEKMQAVSQNGLLEVETTKDDDQQRLSLYFNDVVQAMEAYLKPLLVQFHFSWQPNTFTSVAESLKTKGKEKEDKNRAESAKGKTKEKEEKHRGESPKGKLKDKEEKSRAESAKGKAKEKEDKSVTAQGTPSPPAELGECVILLTDKLLMDLPLEALSILREEGISSVSRDFSLQLLYNRFHNDEQADTDAKRDVKSAKESKPKLEQKKNAKLAATKSLPPNCLAVETHHFKYIVDPFNEAEEPDSVSPAHRMKEVLEKYHKVTQTWNGFMGFQHVPSHAEWENLLSSCSAFIFFGTERFLSHILVEKLVAMNLSECQLMILLDLAQTSCSFLRQSNLDAEKSALHLSLEKPVESAVLISLTGVRSIMVNLWHTTLEQNTKRLLSLTENLLGIGKTTGQAIQDLRRLGGPHLLEKMNEEPSLPVEEPREALLGSEPSESCTLQPASFSYILYGLPNLVAV
ncbi:cilia- and flagella-associated protein 46 isoform X1 [Pleurodeles waltl]|uniref:cilia- and flagella-associated protein 46 isoform X1 n=1 Tax=Pleurodeles waltl TaxID=8319 RepID=UPI0037099B25